MKTNTAVKALFLFLTLVIFSCNKEEESINPPTSNSTLGEYFGDNINLKQLYDYSSQPKPSYIQKDNGQANPITNAKATLGRVLFYDKQLSIDNTVSCASCHKQEFAFSDTARASRGVQNGVTGRHSMRLVNSRFAQEVRFFWDERAASLELQTTQPIQDHAEMGFSGQNNRPDMSDLLEKLAALDYYKELFQFVYGDQVVNESRLQECLAQFIRSIQSFDSKYDVGRAQVANEGAPFPNFTQQENEGKRLYLTPPQFLPGSNIRVGGGAGCQGCHRAPEFDIDQNSQNNGVVHSIAGGSDFSNKRAPTLRDLLSAQGESHGGFMHSGDFPTLESVIDHYNSITVGSNTQLDPRLRPGNMGQQLQLTSTEKAELVAFLKTLSGTQVYTASQWSNPFIK